MRQYQLNKQIKCCQQKFKILGLLFSLLTTLFVNVGVSAFDLITPSGIKKIPNNKHLIINEYQSNKPQLKKANTGKSGIKARTMIASGCIRKNKYSAIISEASQQYKVNKRLIQAIISTESCFNPKAVSPKGAQGLMQLMPFTAKRFGVTNSFDPAQNIMGGVKYLRFLLRRFHGKPSLAIAAYNAGEGAVDHYAGIPPYKETQSYVRKVLGLLGQKQSNKVFVGIKNNEEKDGVITTCISNKKIRSHTYAHYGGKSIKRYYLVRPNDTLLKVSRRVGLDIGIMQKLNKLKRLNKLKNNQIRTLLLSDCPF